ncbi:S8 family serine peptidase [Aegicerativicinus sediminis]|uniref:S8 family serine peptidase n=1 Tax=Aegicerativicinus sediminis TaxID=2893202 RepID=UPI001E45F0AC|nr:S8 family serine peptidase [Aegicerativicinus sediminis]
MKNLIIFSFLLLLSQFGYAQVVEEAWVYFTDKPDVVNSISNPSSILTQRAIDRKQRFGIAIDERDVPVNEAYISNLKLQTGIAVMAKSKWMNAVHVRGTETNVNNLLNLSYVDHIEFAKNKISSGNRVGSSTNKFDVEDTQITFDYGYAANQVEMIALDQLHELDFTGTGLIIAVLDSGFPNVNTLSAFSRLRNNNDLLGGYNFVNRSTNYYDSTLDGHGIAVLSTMAAYIQNNYVGTAPDASYYLFITEDVITETPVEESYWVEAAERADSLGVDVINSSLGYFDFDDSRYDYTPSEMDGKTAFVTRGAAIAAEKGILVVISAGNSGYDLAGTITAPADAENVFSIGAVNADGTRTTFSSVGSSNQPSIKPDVMAQGGIATLVNKNGNVVGGNGTSFSSPIIAGAIACLMQAFPNLSPDLIREKIRESGDNADSPDFLYGYGIPNFFTAFSNLLSTEVFDKSLIRVFPNPAQDFITLVGLHNSTTTSIDLFSITGETIMKYNVDDSEVRIDLSNFSVGLYFLKVKTDFGENTFKIVKH